MKIEFDLKKSNKNIIERNLSFEYASDFQWDTALYAEDSRVQYSEQRFVAVGYLGERLHVMCFTPIPNGVRIISFRKANKREVIRYEEEISYY